jgi:hypothetical protein
MRKAVFGLIVLLIFGFVVLGCDNGTTSGIEGGNDSKLIGRSITIGSNTYSFTADKVIVNGSVEYSYTANGSKLVIADIGIDYTYTISGTGITLTTSTGETITITIETTTTKFEGTWYSPSVNVSGEPEEPGYAEVEIVFSAYTFIFKMTDDDFSAMLKGTFTYTDTDIDFTTTHTSTNGSNWTPVSQERQKQPPYQTYSFTDGKLKLNAGDGDDTYTKQ